MIRYTIERRDDLLIVYGVMPVSELAALTATLPRGSVFCALLPGAMKVNFVAGPPDAINAERERQGIAERVNR